MADYGFDGMVKVSWVSTIANIATPTAAELNAGVALEPRLTADGLDTSAATANIDTSKMNSTANASVIGRDTFTIMVKYVRGSDTAAQLVETTLIRGASGFLVVRRNALSTVAWTVADKVEVYPVQCHRPNPDKPAPNALQAVTVAMENTAFPKAFGDFATVG